MAGDIERFINDHSLDNVILAGHSMYVYPSFSFLRRVRGAKVGLYLTLTKPEIPAALISLENAPISSPLSSTFKQYVEAMKAITDAKLTKRKDAEDLLAKYEEVKPPPVQ
jgi:pimeloyl-ACP methyl ester carboxylesterase